MALFPAYSEVNKQNVDSESEECNNSNQNSEWLSNSSGQYISAYLQNLQAPQKIETCTDSSDDDVADTSIVDKGNEKIKELVNNTYGSTAKVTKRKSRISHYKSSEKDVYFEDKNRNKRFCTIETLERGLRPKYKLSNIKLGICFKRKMKTERFQRYHVRNLDAPIKVKEKDTVIKRESSPKENIETGEEKNNQLEKEQKLMTESFNKRLLESPKDIDTWIEYVLYQDTVTQQSSFYSGNENLNQLINKKKLSIIEKALIKNHDDIKLLKMKLNIMSELLPADIYANDLEEMIQKDPKNIVLWQALIMVIQTSCALCKASKVIDLYRKCLPILKQRPKSDPTFYDKKILGLLYQCLIFLRHAGLWEQMWEIIRINLCLNIPLDHETLKNTSTIDEKTLINMEEIILTSKLPLDQLWLRVESLRENCYWTGVDIKNVDMSVIGDEKRIVSAEETNDFIYPTISKKSNFQLVILSILCLKVPLLPARHCTLEDFQLDEHFWSIDSLEFILPLIYPSVATNDLDDRLSNKTVITELLEGKLTSGPQFLKFHPAQETYVDFIRSVFDKLAQNLPETQRTSIFIWWMRFERLLVFISKNDPLIETNRNKKLKSVLKNFLKKPENRNNLHFYREFAMTERELGSIDSSIQVLKTIIQSQNENFLDTEDRAALFSLYRTLFEILLDSKNYKNSNPNIFLEMVKSLEKYVSKCFDYDHNIVSIEEMLYNEILKFLMNPVTDELEDRLFLPNIYCDTLICYAYLLHTKHSGIGNTADILELFDRCIAHCDKCFRLQERFCETKVVFLQFCQQQMKNVIVQFKNSISEALVKFPNNFFFLSLNALMRSEDPYWKINLQNKNMNIWSIFASCLAGRARATHLKEIGAEDVAQATVNKMFSLHKTVSKTKFVQSCPLIWRFYILLIQEYNLSQKKGEEIYYEAVNQCPWARNVYINAAEIAPQILTQIQDLIKEKELRMHVTPEELDILRE